jgi:hypothetical protein
MRARREDPLWLLEIKESVERVELDDRSSLYHAAGYLDLLGPIVSARSHHR